MEKKVDTSFRQVRHVSGFSRPMSVFDAFVYNFLAMGIIFPWAYLWGPASFPGGNVEVAIWLTFFAQVPISLAYAFLSTVLPVTGGDYVYQTRAFGKWGFVIVMSGFVVWILQWVALSGWLFACLGLAPWLLSMGVWLQAPLLSKWGLAVESPLGVLAVSIVLALFTTMFLIRGMRLYVRVQRVLFALTLAAIAAVVYVFVSSGRNFGAELNQFVATLTGQLGLHVSAGLNTGFVQFLQRDVRNNGVDLSPTWSFWATLGIVPIVWTSLQWATYSVEQNTEIAEADRFSKQLIILLGSAFAVASLLALVAHVEHSAMSKEFVMAASAAYWLQKAAPDTVNFVKTVLQPFPNILAMAATRNILVTTVIAVGFLANAFQVTCNSFIGVTRILVAMSIDGLVSRRLEKVDSHHHSPVRAHWVYFFASIPWIVCYSLVSTWSNWTLGVTFACGYVFTLSALAASRIPTRMRSAWQTSEIYRMQPWLIRSISYLGFSLGAAMVVSYLLIPQLGLTGSVPYAIVIAIVIFSWALYARARSRSKLVAQVFETAPDEVEEFFSE